MNQVSLEADMEIEMWKEQGGSRIGHREKWPAMSPGKASASVEGSTGAGIACQSVRSLYTLSGSVTQCGLPQGRMWFWARQLCIWGPPWRTNSWKPSALQAPRSWAASPSSKWALGGMFHVYHIMHTVNYIFLGSSFCSVCCVCPLYLVNSYHSQQGKTQIF